MSQRDWSTVSNHDLEATIEAANAADQEAAKRELDRRARQLADWMNSNDDREVRLLANDADHELKMSFLEEANRAGFGWVRPGDLVDAAERELKRREARRARQPTSSTFRVVDLAR